MKKDVSICFRTSTDVRANLNKIAEKERLSLSSVIESIIYRHLKTLKDVEGIEKDRRRFERRKAALPAFIGTADANVQEFETGTVLDLSMNGIRFSLPKGTKLEVRSNESEAEYDIIFTLAGQPRPVKVKCRFARIYEYPEEVQVGATFTDYDFHACQALQQYVH